MLRSFIVRYWRDILILIPVLAIATYLRLNDIRGYQVFLGDQGRDALIVKHMIDTCLTTSSTRPCDFVFIGPNASVGGFFLGPLYYYLMIIPMWLSGMDPVGPAIQVAVLSIITTIMIYYYMKRYVCIAAAIVSSSIFAVSVLVVEYARFSWNPNVLPFFIMIMLIAWTKILTRDTTRMILWFGIIGLMIGSIVQLHYAALIMVFISGVLYLWHIILDSLQHNAFRIRKYIGELLAVIAACAFVLLPFIGFEIKNGLPNTCGVFNATVGNGSLKAIPPFREFFTYCSTTYPLTIKSSDDIFNNDGAPFEFIIRDVVHRLFYRLVTGGYEFGQPDENGVYQDPNYTMAIVYVILIIAALYAIYRMLTLLIIYVRNTDQKSTARAYLRGFIAEESYQTYTALFLIFSTWWIIGVGWWGFYKKSIYDYYFSYMYVLPILTFGIATALLFHMYSRRLVKANIAIRIGKIALWLFVGMLVTMNILKLQTIFPGMQVQRAEAAADSIIKMLGAGPYNFALIADGNSDHAYRFFLERKGYTPVSIDVEVTDQLIVLCEIDISKKPCEPEGNSLWEVAGFGPSKIVGQSTAIGFPLYRLQHVDGEQWRIGLPAQKGN